ncbi:polysaccharide pyruvyl transferase family protein [Erwinia sp. JUb26]|uniref:polysaccharide pyruvyl transferase family protein n=1 Tax=Erwinia sp. JUb26 TaxID=2485126 RepID=UPI000F49043C|nr:polysaccharide pyruvyl transferase family protein [Erwinia sp. JUb26]ROR07727.1 polysaccharide pyruvyl transferase WcaK-like protein [Erwinia sp. JUb26]
MKKNKVYIRGAYAPGNIGDDVLMISVINIVKKVVKDEHISVGVEHPELAKKFNPKVDWVHIKKPISAEVVVFGGGGQFFSFNPPPGIKIGFFAKFKKALKAQENIFSAVERVYVSYKGAIDKIFFYKKMSAFCIGLGPFDNKGKSFERAKHIINKCDYISVRDDKSKAFCEMLGYKNAVEFTDPSLLSNIWYPEEVAKPYYSEDGYVSLVLRDWPHDANGQNCIAEMIKFGEYLIEKGEKVRFVSLYKEREAQLLADNSRFEWLIWDPKLHTIPEFMNEFINNSEVIISSRAHGVLLPASLGVPTIAVAIENKLIKVHGMISDGNILINEMKPECFIENLALFRETKEVLRNNLQKDIEMNKVKVTNAIEHFTSWLKNNV